VTIAWEFEGQRSVAYLEFGLVRWRMFLKVVVIVVVGLVAGVPDWVRDLV
jgi:hypothetical protein